MSEEKHKEGITVSKIKDFSEWYTQVIQKAELADYTKVSGCLVLRPRAYEIWEAIQDYFNKRIKRLGIRNAYFPSLIPESLLQREADHVEGFAPEVAWVTHAGTSKLSERLAIRPTSETIMYDTYKNWIQSHRDLPLLINQWCNIVRWEFKHPIPFIRTREFLWQEGHTAHATREGAEKEVRLILEIYADVYEKLLAVPVIRGKKSDKEKFAGAVYTTSIEAFSPNGKAIQAGTSHLLGQNFAKAFGISFLDEDGKQKYVWQNSWGLSTRALGAMIMVHGDDRGLVLPPRVAYNKVVIVPIVFKNDKEHVIKKAKEMRNNLSRFNPILDDREGYTPGWKFNEWEMKGVPIRIELGPKDIASKQAVVVRRDTGKKETVKFTKLKQRIEELLEDIQNSLFTKAQKQLKDSTVEPHNWKEFVKAIKENKLVCAPWCQETDCEDHIKDKSGGAKSLNIPFNQKKIKAKCIHCGKDAEYKAYFAKSY
ncbi:proline--tRNA ligase [Candidatus Woesearchaeota archaeon]|nr:proline--tRNA ligase [Candidatus Woesearchaeota archaeon]